MINKKSKVLISSPDIYAKRFSVALAKRQVDFLHLPIITTQIIKNSLAMQNLLINLADFDYLAFSSRMAIEAFLFYLKQEINNISLDKVKFWAMGKDAELLQEHFPAHKICIPKEASPSGIVAQLKDIENIHRTKIGVISPLVCDIQEPEVVPNFIADLEKIMQVVRIDGYQTSINAKADFAIWRDKIENQVSCLAFTSMGEIEAMLKIFDKSILETKKIGCFGPYTARNARKAGLRVDFIGEDYSSFDGFVATILKNI